MCTGANGDSDLLGPRLRCSGALRACCLGMYSILLLHLKDKSREGKTEEIIRTDNTHGQYARTKTHGKRSH